MFNGVSVDGLPVDGISVKGYQQKVPVHYWSLYLEAKGNGNVPI
jgi:hypothetical protein